MYDICYRFTDSPVFRGFPLNTVILISEGKKDKRGTEEDYGKGVKCMEVVRADKEGDITDVE